MRISEKRSLFERPALGILVHLAYPPRDEIEHDPLGRASIKRREKRSLFERPAVGTLVHLAYPPRDEIDHDPPGRASIK